MCLSVFLSKSFILRRVVKKCEVVLLIGWSVYARDGFMFYMEVDDEKASDRNSGFDRYQ